MTLLETLKKSLSAAEYVLADLELRMKLSDDDSLNIGNGALDALTESITALRSAIEQVELEEPVAFGWFEDGDMKALAFSDVQFTPKYSHNAIKKPLYTTPQPRQWVGLSDDEIDKTQLQLMRLGQHGVHNFARAIEADFKAKNGG